MIDKPTASLHHPMAGVLTNSSSWEQAAASSHPTRISDSHFHPTGYTAAQRVKIESYTESLRTIIGFMDKANVGRTTLMCIPTYIRDENGKFMVVDCHGLPVDAKSGGDFLHGGPLSLAPASPMADDRAGPSTESLPPRGVSSPALDPRTADFAAILGAAKQYYAKDDLRYGHAPMTNDRYVDLQRIEQVFRPEVDRELALAITQLTPAERERFNPMITGLDLADGQAPLHILHLLNDYPGVFDGFGEITIKKELVGGQNKGYRPSFDETAPINKVLHMAARIGAPAVVHCDIEDYDPGVKGSAARKNTAQLLEGPFENLNSIGQKHLEAAKLAFETSESSRSIGRIEHSLRRVKSHHDIDAGRVNTNPTPLEVRDFESAENMAALQRLWSKAGKTYVEKFLERNPGMHTKPDNLEDIKQLFQRHPHTQIVWAHCGGLGRFVEPHPNHVGYMRDVLNSCPNVKVDLSWDEVAKYFSPIEKTKPGSEPVQSDPAQAALAQARLAMLVGLIKDCPDRFLFGSDSLVPKGPDSLLSSFRMYHGHDPGNSEKVPGDSHDPERLSLASMLSPIERQAVFSGNHEKMFGKASQEMRQYEATQMKDDFARLQSIMDQSGGTLPNHWPD
jgi:hypothetical protein